LPFTKPDANFFFSGAAASKPVMEGKAVLFKKFGGVDAFDIELDCSDPEKFIDMVVALGPTFGGINIEDVKAPECFYIEREAQRRSNIPIMHGTKFFCPLTNLPHDILSSFRSSCVGVPEPFHWMVEHCPTKKKKPLLLPALALRL
jgi:hypothetical protein